MLRKTVIVGNWKMNKTPAQAKQFMEEFTQIFNQEKTKISNQINFGIASPSIDLMTIKENQVQGMIIAAQDVHAKESGAFTGDLSIEMIKSVGANAVVIGHSERRAYHGEDDNDVNQKTKVALQNQIMPIVCIGETLEQRENNTWKSVIKTQVSGAMKDIDPKMASKIIIAYEPIWAIGTGVTATADQAQEACKYVRETIASELSQEASQSIIIQYGGSVKPENVSELMSKPDIDGALVGGASLEASSFIKLLTLNK